MIFSFVGYLPRGIIVGNQTALSVTLKVDSKSLDEVVVVSYGTQKKVNLTGAVDQVTSEVLENRSLPNLPKGLQGTIPNLNMGDGKPIQSPTYNIRNVNSISIMRYAEILLNYAEAKTELGTLTNEDGKNDVVFYKIKPATQLPGVTYINVA